MKPPRWSRRGEVNVASAMVRSGVGFGCSSPTTFWWAWARWRAERAWGVGSARSRTRPTNWAREVVPSTHSRMRLDSRGSDPPAPSPDRRSRSVVRRFVVAMAVVGAGAMASAHGRATHAPVAVLERVNADDLGVRPDRKAHRVFVARGVIGVVLDRGEVATRLGERDADLALHVVAMVGGVGAKPQLCVRTLNAGSEPWPLDADRWL